MKTFQTLSKIFHNRVLASPSGSGGNLKSVVIATSIAVFLVLTAPIPVQAQGALEEIVVTARFREENLQSTPLAITAVTGESLEARSALSTLDLDAFVPNAVIAPLGAGWGSTAAAFVRGIGLGDNSLSFEPGVPIYIDDVYHGRPQGAVLDLLDLERVEVLRGPQGTLFGKNTLGGAVRMISRKPQGDNTGYIDVGIGERDKLTLRGSYDFAIVPDQLFVRIAASSKRQDGYFDILDYECVNGAGSLGLGGPGIAAGVFNPATPFTTALTTHPAVGGIRLGSVTGNTDSRGCVVDHLGGENVQSGRVAMRFIGSEAFEVNLIGDITYMDQEGPADKYHIQLRTSTTQASNLGIPGFVQAGVDQWNSRVAIPVFGAGGQYDGRFQTANGYTGYHRFGIDPLTGRDTPNLQLLTHWGLQGTVDWDLTEDIHLKSVTSYREFDNSFGRDSDGTPLPQLFTWDTSIHEQFTQEVQLTGMAWDDRVAWTVGGFYYDAFDSNAGFVTTYPYNSTFSDHRDVQDLSNWALFFHLDWQINDKLSLSGGIRYTEDEKTANIYRVTGNTAPTGVGLPQYVLIPNSEVGVTSEEWSPKVSLDYQWTDDIMTYAQFSTGFRGGGFAPRPANAGQLKAFTPEFLDNYEVGIKTDWFDRRLRLNGTVYYMESADKQQPAQTCSPCAPIPVNFFSTVNTGESRNWGVEVEAQAEPVDGLRIDGSLGYQNYKVTDQGTSLGILIYVPDTTADQSIRGDVMYSPRTPEWNWAIGAEHEYAVGGTGSTITPRLDFNYQSTIWFATNPVAGIVNESDGRQPEYMLMNGRVTWRSPEDRWAVSLYALNLTDEYYYWGKLSLLANSGREQGNPAPPREFGLNVRFNF